MTLRDDLHAVEMRQVQSIAFIRGALVIGALLIGSVQWYALRQLDYLVAQGKTVIQHEQRLATLEAQCKPTDADRAIK